MNQDARRHGFNMPGKKTSWALIGGGVAIICVAAGFLLGSVRTVDLEMYFA
jgi:hypothetical protein